MTNKELNDLIQARNSFKWRVAPTATGSITEDYVLRNVEETANQLGWSKKVVRKAFAEFKRDVRHFREYGN